MMKNKYWRCVTRYVTYICIHRRSRETLGFIIERVHNFSLVRVQREEWHEKKERGASCQERANTPTALTT